MPPAKKTNQTSPRNNLLDILLKSGKLDPTQHEKLKIEQLNSGSSFEDLIRLSKLISEKDLLLAKSELFNIPYKDLDEVSVSPEAVTVLPEVVARRFIVFPLFIDKKNDALHLAMANPLDLSAIGFLEKKTKKKIVPYFSLPEEIKQVIDEKYTQSLAEEVTEALKEGGMQATRQSSKKTIRNISEVVSEAPISKIVSTILEFAMKSRASDIHIEPQEEKTRIRYRIDGILHEKLILPSTVHEAVIARIKILCGMKIDEKRVPQDGRFNFHAGEDEVDLRVSSLPVTYGEKIVMRLLKKAAQVPSMADLGLRGRALSNLEEAILVPHGIILVTGPTGSGKTTTLYSVLSKINTPRVNIITLEDPVEYEMPGINQVQVNPQAGLTFASGLRSFLRQDPNIILVGEIRDKETTELAIQASLTGHLVFSTLHTNNASGALPRLLDLEAEPFLLASSITTIVGQRICRRICSHCKETYSPGPEIIQDMKKILGPLVGPFAKQGKFILYRGKKCSHCNETGYLDRIGIFEVLPIFEKIGRLILERSPANAIEKESVANGMITMKQDGYLKALEGLTTLEEVLRVAQE